MSAIEATENRAAARRPDGMPVGTPFPAGNNANPGGKPKKLREIEKMLDEDHRNVSVMREVFSRLKALALGEVVAIAGKDGEVHLELRADPAFMKLYLDRVLGPVKELITDDDLRDAPDAVIDWLRRAA